jgi:lysozyme
MQRMQLSERGFREIISHEAIVPYCYVDSVGVLTWGVGHTAGAGEPNPADLQMGLAYKIEDVIDVLRHDVRKFEARVNRALRVKVSQHQFDALVSFDFNTGGIERAALTRHINTGDLAAAAEAFMSWSKPPEVVGRRRKEQKLFRDGAYSSDGFCSVYPADQKGRVLWRKGKRHHIDDILSGIVTPPMPEPRPEIPAERPIEDVTRLEEVDVDEPANRLPPPRELEPLGAPAYAGDEFPLRVGSHGRRVAELQRHLDRLDYPTNVDGARDEQGSGFGNMTRDSVLAWQADNGFTPTGAVDAEMFDFIRTSQRPRPLSQKRLETTVEDLRREGDKPIGFIDRMKANLWWFLGLLGIGGAERETGVIDRLTQGTDSGVLRMGLDFVGANRGTFILIGIVCLGVWWFTRKIERARVAEKRSGRVI